MTRLARTSDGQALLGTGEGYVPLRAAHPDLETVDAALPEAASDGLDPTAAGAEPIPRASFDLATPLPEPGSLWGIGLNFADHAGDLDADQPSDPATFLMPATAATGPGGPIRLPGDALAGRVTAEAELAVVIGRTCRSVPAARASEMIAGYLPVIDVTAEDVLDRNPRYLTRSKAADTFLVLGEAIRTAGSVDSLDELTITTRVDGDVVARAPVSEMRFRPIELIADLSRTVTLQPGDILCTGTPGAGPIEPGSTVTASVDGVGSVSATVVGDE